jgi:hypothetical protein
MLVIRDRCPGCHGAAFDQIIREAYASPPLTSHLTNHYGGRANTACLKDFDYELVRCRNCQLGYQRAIPGPELLAEIYEHWVPPSERERLQREYTLEDYCYFAEQVQFLVRTLGQRPYSLRVLDFGLGWSEWASMARAFGCQVAGSELSSARIEYARSIGIGIVEWHDIPRQRFHFINTEQVFEHLVHPLDTLKHLAGALEDEGLIKVSVPDAGRALRILEKQRTFRALPLLDAMAVTPLEHINCFEHYSLVAMAKNAGLRPFRPSLSTLYNSSSGWLNAKRALKLALRPLYRHWFPKSTFVYFTRAR